MSALRAWAETPGPTAVLIPEKAAVVRIRSFPPPGGYPSMSSFGRLRTIFIVSRLTVMIRWNSSNG